MNQDPALPRDQVVQRLRSAGCVFADDEAELLLAETAHAQVLEHLVAQRVSGIPLEHLLGWVAFRGLRVTVQPGVFVPRRRSELLVAEAVRLARPGAVVVDVCCGSGAIGLAVAAAVPGVEVHATDIDPVAVGCAAANLAPVGGLAHHGDLYDPLPADLTGRVDVLVVNPPYVPSDRIALMPSEAREHEPRIALDGGTDGLDLQRRVVAGAREWLLPGGHLLVETGHEQVEGTSRLVHDAGLTVRTVADDDLEATVVIGAAPRSPWPGTTG